MRTELNLNLGTFNFSYSALDPRYSLPCRMSYLRNGFNCRGSRLRGGKSSLSQVKEEIGQTESFGKQDQSGIK
jgi:hypothetical protein